MDVACEVMQLIDGRLFDGEWYERTELLRGSFAGESGYLVAVWPTAQARPDEDPRPRLEGPFASADLASKAANELI